MSGIAQPTICASPARAAQCFMAGLLCARGLAHDAGRIDQHLQGQRAADFFVVRAAMPWSTGDSQRRDRVTLRTYTIAAVKKITASAISTTAADAAVPASLHARTTPSAKYARTIISAHWNV